MRKLRLTLKQSGVILGLLLALLTGPSYAQEPTTEPEPPIASAYDRRFGLVDSFTNTAEASAAGAGWTRVFFRWDVVQQGGPSDWKPTNVPDPLINGEIAAGREVVAVLIGTPAWATDSQNSTAVPPAGYWGDFAYKIASQYKGRIRHWVIWNVPDVDDPASASFTLAGNEEDYFRLLKEAYTKIKDADPDAQVHLAGLTYTWDQERGQRQYLARLLDLIIADPDAAANNYYFDAVSYHLYYNPGQIRQTILSVRDILNSYDLGSKPIWINETNAPPSEDFIEPPAGSAGLSVTLEEQSAFVVQAFAAALAGGAERIAFNKLSNGPDSAMASGLLRGDNSRRPAFDAFRTVTTYFAGTRQADWQQAGDVSIVTLDRGEATTTVLWNNSRQPVNYQLSAIAAEAAVVDQRGEAQTILADNGGYTVELPGATCSNGEYCFIGGAPLLIVEAGSAEQRVVLSEMSALAEPSLAEPALDQTPLAEAGTVSSVDALSAGEAAEIAAGEAMAAPAVQEPVATPAPTLESPPQPGPESEGSVPAQPANAVIGGEQATSPPEPGILPDPDADPFAAPAELPLSEAPETTLTPVPPVTIGTVLTPTRLLWLFIIGLVVFTVAYGIQIALWYRFKR